MWIVTIRLPRLAWRQYRCMVASASSGPKARLVARPAMAARVVARAVVAHHVLLVAKARPTVASSAVVGGPKRAGDQPLRVVLAAASAVRAAVLGKRAVAEVKVAAAVPRFCYR